MQTFVLQADQTVRIYKHFNAQGKVYLKISTPSGRNEVKAWWTKGPFGSNKHLGLLAGNTEIVIEGWPYGRLKAHAFEDDTHSGYR